MVVLALDVLVIALAHLVERALPQVIQEREHVGLAAQRERVVLALAARLLPMLAGILEGVLQAAVHLEPRVDSALHGHLVRRPLHRHAARARVRIAGVLADHHVVNVLGALSLQGALDPGVEPDRAQVDVLVQIEAKLQQDPLFKNARLDVGMADGAQQNRIVLAKFVDSVRRQDLAGPKKTRAAEIIVGEIQFEIELRGGRLEDLHGLPGHFRTCTVAADYRDVVALAHVFHPFFPCPDGRRTVSGMPDKTRTNKTGIGKTSLSFSSSSSYSYSITLSRYEAVLRGTRETDSNSRDAAASRRDASNRVGLVELPPSQELRRDKRPKATERPRCGIRSASGLSERLTEPLPHPICPRSLTSSGSGSDSMKGG